MSGNEDEGFMRRAIEASRQAALAGHQPYGAVLVPAGASEVTAVATNSQAPGADPTGHAEMNLIRQVCASGHSASLRGATVYASGEPCPMCAAALYWAGIGRIVFGATIDRMGELCGDASILRPGCGDLLRGSNRPVIVDGPLLEAEAARVIAAATPSQSHQATTP